MLLILAGVTVSTLAGDNGLLNRTTSTKEKTEQAGIMENIKLAFQSAKIGEYVGDSGSLSDKVKTEIEKIYGTGTVKGITEDSGVYTVTMITGYGTYTIEENGEVSKKEGITLSESIVELQIIDGVLPDAVTLVAEIEGLEGEEIKWNLSGSASDIEKITLTTQEDKKITTVQVTGETEGEVIIIAEYGNEIAKCTLKKVISVTSISSITLNVPSPAEVTEGETIEITATINEDATEVLKWESLDTTKAIIKSISADGKTAIIEGKSATNEVTIKAKAENIEQTCKIKVKELLGYIIQDENTKKVYYYIGATRKEITKENLGDYLGMKINYIPGGNIQSKTSNGNMVDIGTSSEYRLFFVDFGTDENGKYGDGKGTIYLKANSDGGFATCNDLPDGTGETKTNEFNRLWYEDDECRSHGSTNVNKLLDKSIWSVYKDSGTKPIANYVVGAPSIEMWIDSYNIFLSRNPVDGKELYNYTVTQDTETLIEGTEQKKGPVGENKGYGYYVGHGGNYAENKGYSTNNNTLIDYTSYSTDSKLQDRTLVWIGGLHYWLASKRADGGGSCYVDPGAGYLDSSSYPTSYRYFCPIVCCNAGVEIWQAE